MSIYKQIFATASVFAMTAALVITPSASAQNSVAGAVTTTSNTNGYSFCSAAMNGYVVNDINGSIKTTSDATLRNFYVIRNADKTNDSCTNGFVKTNYLPVFANHTTTFDLDTNGAPVNVKVSNTNPSSYTVTCSGTDTVLTVTDAERDLLTLNQTVKADDFNVTSTNGNNNELKVTFSRKDSTVKTVNVADIYITEGSVSGNAGQFRTDAYGTSIAVVTSATTLDATAKVVKLAGISIASPNCDSTLNVAPSSMTSSSMMSSSMTSSSMMSSSSKAATTTTTTTTTEVVTTGKGSTVRTGGAN